MLQEVQVAYMNNSFFQNLEANMPLMKPMQRLEVKKASFEPEPRACELKSFTIKQGGLRGLGEKPTLQSSMIKELGKDIHAHMKKLELESGVSDYLTSH